MTNSHYITIKPDPRVRQTTFGAMSISHARSLARRLAAKGFVVESVKTREEFWDSPRRVSS